MSTFEFDDQAHVERLVGTLHAPGSTTGDVLTVNADKSVSPAPGGGSTPGALQRAEMLITETPGAGTYTGTFDVAAGSRVFGLIVVCDNWFLADTCDVEIADSVNSYLSTGVFNAGDLLSFPYDPLTATPLQQWLNAADEQAQLTAPYQAALGKQGDSQGPGILPPGVPYPNGDTITVAVTTTGDGGVQGVYRVILLYSGAVTPTDAAKA